MLQIKSIELYFLHSSFYFHTLRKHFHKQANKQKIFRVSNTNKPLQLLRCVGPVCGNYLKDLMKKFIDIDDSFVCNYEIVVNPTQSNLQVFSVYDVISRDIRKVLEKHKFNPHIIRKLRKMIPIVELSFLKSSQIKLMEIFS